MKIHFVVGATGAGKSTYAIKLAEERKAVRFVTDDWLNTLFVPDGPPKEFWPWALERVDRCEQQIWKTSRELLHRGVEVVLDVNMMNRAVREKQRATAKASGFPFQIHYLDVDRNTRWERISKRNQEKGVTYSFPVSKAFFDFVESVIEPLSDNELEGAIVHRHNAGN